MERLLLYIIEVIVAEPDCSIERCNDGINGAQWIIQIDGRSLFVLDKRDINMLRTYIIENPRGVDAICEKRFSRLFDQTLGTLSI